MVYKVTLQMMLFFEQTIASIFLLRQLLIRTIATNHLSIPIQLHLSQMDFYKMQIQLHGDKMLTFITAMRMSFLLMMIQKLKMTHFITSVFPSQPYGIMISLMSYMVLSLLKMEPHLKLWKEQRFIYIIIQIQLQESYGIDLMMFQLRVVLKYQETISGEAHLLA